jgi:hypothetical protein
LNGRLLFTVGAFLQVRPRPNPTVGAFLQVRPIETDRPEARPYRRLLP